MSGNDHKPKQKVDLNSKAYTIMLLNSFLPPISPTLLPKTKTN